LGEIKKKILKVDIFLHYCPVNFMRFLASLRNDRYLETIAFGSGGLAAVILNERK
jgi:hypothetical protein